jgi:hypothetical protein
LRDITLELRWYKTTTEQPKFVNSNDHPRWTPRKKKSLQVEVCMQGASFMCEQNERFLSRDQGHKNLEKSYQVLDFYGLRR